MAGALQRGGHRALGRRLRRPGGGAALDDAEHTLVVPYSPLGRGFLTGDFKPVGEYPADDMRSWSERRQPGNYEKNVAAVEQLTALAGEKDVTVAQLALAWLLAQGDDVVPIPGTRSAARVEENVGAAEVELSAADLERVEAILPGGAYGSRYPEAMMPVW